MAIKPLNLREVANSRFETLVKISADSVDKLRKSDVDRVLTECPTSSRKQFSEWLKSKRPDLATEIDEVLEDL